ncbi:MAG TPA: heterodisulfide reductase, partial [Dehalococcoidia bacterium]|nr:heterodisulfide reductase [Dehalococcoidia bacterium]
VTPCPLCHLNLDGGQADAAGVVKANLDLPVLHLPQLVGLAFGIPASSLGFGKNIVSTNRVLQKAGR